MKLIKTGSEYYGLDNQGNSFSLTVDEDYMSNSGTLSIQIKQVTPEKWMSASEHRAFLTKIIESINELEIIYGTQKIGN